MLDGSDAISDWPILNALLSCASGADLVAVRGLGNWGVSAGVTTVADGSSDAAQRLARVMDNDTAIGIARHASAGFLHSAEGRRVGVRHATPPAAFQLPLNARDSERQAMHALP